MSRKQDPADVSPERGLLVVGHGSREQAGIDEFLATADLLRSRAAAAPVEAGFLEFAAPTISEAFCKLAERGVRRVTVVPAILFSAGHARHDIPAAVAAAAANFPDIVVEQTEHLGCHSALVRLSQVRFLESIAQRDAVPVEETSLVMIGRGSRDASATAEMKQFLELRRQCMPVARAEMGFIAMAAPHLEELLTHAAEWDVTRVVVQPHLLFAGVLLERIGSIVERFARGMPRVEWVVTQHLGPDALLADALWQRASTGLHAARLPRSAQLATNERG